MTKRIAGDGERPRYRLGKVLGAAVSGVLVVALSGCGGGSGGGGKTQNGFTQAKQSGGKLTVWVDSTRMPAAQLYQKQHPEVKMDIVS